MEVWLYLITALLYAALAAASFSAHRFTLASAGGGALGGGANWRAIVLPVALALHALTLYRAIFTLDGLNLSLGHAISLIVWLSLLIYWMANFRWQVAALQSFILPVAALAVFAPLALPPARVLPYSGMAMFHVHVVISMLAYSLLTIAAVHALLMAALTRRLHEVELPPQYSSLPSLMTMETLLFRILAVGFTLLTLSVASGVFFSEELFGRPFRFTHKNVFGILSWLVFAWLLVGRYAYGWRGRRAVRWTLAGFVLLLLAYVGSKFVSQVILQRP